MSGIKPGKKSEKGTPIGAPASKPKANLGEGHPAKSNSTDFADLRKWYAKLDRDTKSAMDKAADKPDSLFTNEERNSFYLNVDPYHYNQYLQFRYPGKTEFIQDRMKSYYGFRRQLEENGIVPKKPSEVKPETQYAEQMVKNTKEEKATSTDDAESLWNVEYKPHDNSISEPKPAETKADQSAANPEKVSETQVAKQMVENTEAPAEQTKSEKPSEGATADAWFADMLSPDKLAAVDAAAKKQKAIEKQEAQDVQDALERQAAQDMVDSSKPTESYVSYKRNMQKQDTAKPADYPEFTELPMSNYYPLAYANGVYTPRLGNNSLNYSNTRHASNYPTRNGLFYDGQYPFEAYEGMGNVKFVPMYNPHYPRERLYSRPEDYYPNPFEKRKYDIDIQRYPALTETQRKLKDTAEVLGLGLGGIGLVGYIGGQQAQERQRQSQTQIPDQVEPESVNGDIPQVEPTLEQQYAIQNVSPFDYVKAANLFDLYDRYGSPDSIDNSISEEQPADENTLQPDSDAYKNAQEMGQRIASGTGYAPELKKDNFEFPQNSPKVGSSIKTAGLKSPDGGEVPQELNRLSGVKPRVVKDTSKGPVVLNDPNHRKTRDVQNNSVTPEQAAAKQMVNQYAGIPVEVVRAKNQPFLTTDAIWNRLRQKGLVSPEEGIRSGLFTPDEVRYITENDLWRYR